MGSLCQLSMPLLRSKATTPCELLPSATMTVLPYARGLEHNAIVLRRRRTKCLPGNSAAPRRCYKLQQA